MDVGVAVNSGGGWGGVRSFSGAMLAVVMGLKMLDDMRGLDGRSWCSSAESLKVVVVGEEERRSGGARMTAMLKTSTKLVKKSDLERRGSAAARSREPGGTMIGT